MHSFRRWLTQTHTSCEKPPKVRRCHKSKYRRHLILSGAACARHGLRGHLQYQYCSTAAAAARSQCDTLTYKFTTTHPKPYAWSVQCQPCSPKPSFQMADALLPQNALPGHCSTAAYSSAPWLSHSSTALLKIHNTVSQGLGRQAQQLPFTADKYTSGTNCYGSFKWPAPGTQPSPGSAWCTSKLACTVCSQPDVCLPCHAPSSPPLSVHDTCDNCAVWRDTEHMHMQYILLCTYTPYACASQPDRASPAMLSQYFLDCLFT